MKKSGWLLGTLAVLIAAVAFLVYTEGNRSGTAAETASVGRTEQTGSGEPSVNARAELAAISAAIPVYEDAQYRGDLSRQDSQTLQAQYAPGTRIYTMATDDSFPQVWHYYVNYLAQFRAFEAVDPYPPSNQNWRTIEISLSDAMQDPFIPGDSLAGKNSRVTLQIAETEAEPPTVIRYIVQPAAAAPPATTVAGQPTANTLPTTAR